ncbi:MAG: GNAT family N-acetyltransferase [Chloroflexi bacterium]|nr:GNAT family N-acetyltransferase [Chloroflexota bacterium]
MPIDNSVVDHNLAETVIRPARPNDAAAIYALMQAVFGASYLLYTIYQSPKAVAYLRELLTEDSARSLHTFVLVEQGTQLLGYYHAMSRGEEFFLNYIAVSPHFQHCRLGERLLLDFERYGAWRGSRSLSLDVFESNTNALQWYLRQGYRVQKSSFLSRIIPASVSGSGLVFEPGDWAQARSEEQLRGFSKVTGTCSNASITVGLIADHVCKLLAFDGVSLQDAIAAISNHFCDRQVIIVSSENKLPADWNVLTAERTLYLTKEIR